MTNSRSPSSRHKSSLHSAEVEYSCPWSEITNQSFPEIAQVFERIAVQHRYEIMLTSSEKDPSIHGLRWANERTPCRRSSRYHLRHGRRPVGKRETAKGAP